jgi:hypothetical protein
VDPNKEFENAGGTPLWKQGITFFLRKKLKIKLMKSAVRLRLMKSIRMSKKLLVQDESTKENKETMNMVLGAYMSCSWIQNKPTFFIKGIYQMQKTVELLKAENVPIIEEKLKNLPYTKEAVNQLKACLNKMRKFFLNISYLAAWDKLNSNRLKKSRISLFNKQRNLPSKLLPVVIDLVHKYRI